jgi:hypothetical protein
MSNFQFISGNTPCNQPLGIFLSLIGTSPPRHMRPEDFSVFSFASFSSKSMPSQLTFSAHLQAQPGGGSLSAVSHEIAFSIVAPRHAPPEIAPLVFVTSMSDFFYSSVLSFLKLPEKNSIAICFRNSNVPVCTRGTDNAAKTTCRIGSLVFHLRLQVVEPVKDSWTDERGWVSTLHVTASSYHVIPHVSIHEDNALGLFDEHAA